MDGGGGFHYAEPLSFVRGWAGAPAPLPSMVSPGSVNGGSCVLSEITPGALGGGGKTVGSNVIEVATPSLFAVAMAALKLPPPESFALVTTIAHEEDASNVNKLSNARKTSLPKCRAPN